MIAIKKHLGKTAIFLNAKPIQSDYNNIKEENQGVDMIVDRIEQFNQKVPDLVSERMREWLINSKYFDLPASTKYHGVFDGGLYLHSMEVTKMLEEYTASGLCKWDRVESPFIIGMFHDLCKIDFYIKVDGEWEYRRNRIYPGHAENSIILLQRFIELTDQEIACIRWHMGAFSSKEDWSYYSRAVSRFQEVLYTHTADMHASKVVGI